MLIDIFKSKERRSYMSIDNPYNLQDLPEYNNIEPKDVPTNTESSLTEVATENTSEDEATKEIEKKGKTSTATKVTTALASTLVVFSGSSVLGISFGTTSVVQVEKMQLADNNNIKYKFIITNKNDQLVYFLVNSPAETIYSEDVSEKKAYEGTIKDLAYSTTYTCKIKTTDKDGTNEKDIYTENITTETQPVSYQKIQTSNILQFQRSNPILSYCISQEETNLINIPIININ